MNFWNAITVTDIQSIITVASTKGRRFEMKERQNYGLSFCLSGEIVYTKNEKKFVSERSVAVLLPMNGKYSLYGAETGDFPLINFDAPEGITGGEIIVTPLHNPEAYFRDYDALREAWLLRRDRARAMSILYGIFSRLAREDEPQDFHPIRPAMEYLTAHFSDPSLSCATLADAVHLSEVYFRRLFKEHYGVSPKQYVQELRIHHAKNLLAERRATVTEIAEACGFSSVYHFCRAFRRATGETPTEYRRKEQF